MEILQPGVGDRVRVRQRSWTVQNVDSYEHCRIVTLVGTSSSGTVQTQCVIHPFDDVEPANRTKRARRVGIRAWRHACRALLLEDGPAWGLRTAVFAGIELLPYQLEPALALLHGLASRLLVADEVGLGKTVQAMLAIAELRARGIISRVLVLCPAGIREQWVEECASRFRLPLTLLDQAGLRRVRAALPVGVNPWTTVSLAVASVDFVKRPEVLPSVLEANWDMVVVDEAHGACGLSERRDAVSSLCRRAPYVLLLSATPHNGDEAAFTTLCGLGRHDDELVVFRRSRLEAGRDAGRRAHTVRVRTTDGERRMYAALAALTRAVRRESADLDRSVWLMLSVLHKRALSSPYALAASAERRLQLLGEPRAASIGQMLLPWDDESGELDATDAAPMWSEPALKDHDRERRLLEQVVKAAREAEGAEGKLRRLHRLLRSVREPVIIFTEYRDTLLHVRNQVAPRAAVIHGGMTREQRRAALDAFPSAGVLLATDAAGEGLNLQSQCRCVINLELPWNPMRLEQRIGRVDRIGQRRRVHVFHLVSAHAGETRLLERLSTRVSHANARLGAPNPLIGRPEWTEDSSARLIVLHEDTPEVLQPEWTAPPVPLTRLRNEGNREAARLAAMRRIAATEPRSASAGTSPAPSSPLVGRARRRQTRDTLRGRLLLLVRSSVMDGVGHLVCTRVDGVVLDLAKARISVEALTRLPFDSLVPAGSALRHDESLRAHAQMTRRWLDRARAIAALFRETRAEHQPGLFDRRAESEWRHDAESRSAALAASVERISRAERALEVRASEPELVLVLGSGPVLGR